MPVVGFTSQVSVNDASAGTVYGWIPQVKEVTMAGRETGSTDVTPLYQTAGTAAVFERVFIPTRLINPGMLKLKLFYDSASWNRMNALLGVDFQAAAVPTRFRFTAPDSDGAGAAAAQVFTVNGFVTKLGEVQAVSDSVMEYDVEIQLSGAWTVTGG